MWTEPASVEDGQALERLALDQLGLAPVGADRHLADQRDAVQDVRATSRWSMSCGPRWAVTRLSQNATLPGSQWNRTVYAGG